MDINILLYKYNVLLLYHILIFRSRCFKKKSEPYRSMTHSKGEWRISHASQNVKSVFIGCGSKIRTYDLCLMRATSFRAALSRVVTNWRFLAKFTYYFRHIPTSRAANGKFRLMCDRSFLSGPQRAVFSKHCHSLCGEPLRTHHSGATRPLASLEVATSLKAGLLHFTHFKRAEAHQGIAPCSVA